MARLRSAVCVLGVAVLALVVRGFTDGLTIGVAVATVVCALVLVATVFAWWRGRQLGAKTVVERDCD